MVKLDDYLPCYSSPVNQEIYKASKNSNKLSDGMAFRIFLSINVIIISIFYSAGKIAAVKEVLKVVPPQNWFHRYKAINPTGHIYGSRYTSL